MSIDSPTDVIKIQFQCLDCTSNLNDTHMKALKSCRLVNSTNLSFVTTNMCKTLICFATNQLVIDYSSKTGASKNDVMSSRNVQKITVAAQLSVEFNCFH